MKIVIRCWEMSRVYIVTVCGQKARRVDGDRTWGTKLRDRISLRLPAQGIPAPKASSLSGRTLHPLPVLRLVFFRETVELLSYYLSNTTAGPNKHCSRQAQEGILGHVHWIVFSHSLYSLTAWCIVRTQQNSKQHPAIPKAI